MQIEQEIKISNKLGLHARAAAQFVKTANQFSCDVVILKNRMKVNGKSIMGVLTLAASLGTTIKIICNGSDSQEAMAALIELVENKFSEE
jgi:phosphocarrier protein